MSELAARRSRRWIVAAVSVAWLAACGPALIAVTSYRGHLAIDRSGLESLERLLASDGSRKADVLAALGPPVSILGQDDGEIFVYRRVARDTNSVNLNPAYVIPTAPSVPLYVDTDVSGRDDLLMVFFDEQGHLRAASLRRSIADLRGSRAATSSEEIRGWLE
jgi:hypothetical protein